MNRHSHRTALAILVGLSGLACVGLGLAAKWPPGQPFPLLFDQMVSSMTARVIVVATGVAALITAWLLPGDSPWGGWLLSAGFAYDALGQVVRIGHGDWLSVSFLVVDLALMAWAYHATRPGTDGA